MNYSDSQNAVCFENLKQAAVYFDHVIPVAFRFMRGQGEGSDVAIEIPEEISGSILVNLVFGFTPNSNTEKWTRLGKFIDTWEAFAKAIHQARDRFSNSYEDVKRIYLDDAPVGTTSSVRAEFRKFTAALGKNYSSVLLPTNTVQENHGSAYTTLTLARIPFVDTSNATWEQVLELRSDSEAKRKLRNLRLFLHENYRDNSPAFISDDLHRRIEEFQAARRKHGFEMVTGSISALFDAKSLQAAAASALAGTLFGGPIGALTSAVTVEIGSVALEAAKRIYAIKDFENSHELAFLFHANKALS
ncbi:TPA: hypothetical protein ACPWFJ_004100 [Pseudomonas aeruginosa]